VAAGGTVVKDCGRCFVAGTDFGYDCNGCMIDAKAATTGWCG